MNNVTDKLIKAQKQAMAICPAIGGFPVLAEILRQSGVKNNRWILPSCQSIYQIDDTSVVQQGIPLINGMQEIPQFNRSKLIDAIKADQQGLTTFSEFLQAAWDAGIISYDVDFIARTVSYYGINGESHIEEYPAIEVKI